MMDSSSNAVDDIKEDEELLSSTWAPLAPPSHAASIGWSGESSVKEENLTNVVPEPSSLSSSPKKTPSKKRGQKRPRPSSQSTTKLVNQNDSKSEQKNHNQKTKQQIQKTSPEMKNSGRLSPKQVSINEKKHSLLASPSSNDLLPKGVTQCWKGGIAIVTFSGEPVHVCLVGRARVEIIHGQVDLLGYRLTAKNGNNNDDNGDNIDTTTSVTVDSPSWKSVVTIFPTPIEEGKQTVLHLTSMPDRNNNKNVNNEKDATFKVCCPMGEEVRPTVIPHTWQLTMDNITSEFTNNHVDHLSDSDHDEKNPYGGKLLGEEDDDDNASQADLLSQEKKLPASKLATSRARIAICGAKSVGKSTYLRFAIHRLLSQTHKTVALLDCDVGQPEMSPPGMLTLTLVKTPLLHPPHAHMVMGPNSIISKHHVAAYYYGHISSKGDPTLYVQSISKLLKAYENLVDDKYGGDEYQLPLLVNTDGWVKGMGFQVLSALMDVLQPRHVIQLIGENRSKMFDMTNVMDSIQGLKLHVVHSYNNASASTTLSTTADPTTKVSTPAPSRTASVASLASYDENIDTTAPPPPPPITLPTPTSASSIPSMALRSLRLCTYFLGGTSIWENFDDVNFGCTGVYDPNCRIANTLACARPYAVPIDVINYKIMRGCSVSRDFRNDDDIILDALNGAIVGLCRSGEGEGDYNSRAVTDPCLSCIGLGLIRSIDRVRRLFLILTPVSAEDLNGVDTLVGGNLQLPLECLYRGVQSESLPYLCCDGLSVGLGGDVMKSKNYLLRKSTSNI